MVNSNRDNSSAPVRYTLGLDIGMASVGAALLGEGRILGLFVRAFNKAENKDGEALGTAWRKNRGARKRLHSRRRRLRALRALLASEGLPAASPGSPGATMNPWQCRAEGLSRCLTADEWTHTLFHLARHRGYRPRKVTETTDAKAGAIRKAAHALAARLQSGGWETAGQMLWESPSAILPGHPHRRNKAGDYVHTLTRNQVLHEAELLFDRQRTLGNPHAGVAFQAAFVELLDAQSKALAAGAVEAMVGPCTFEPGERRAPLADPLAERLGWLSRLRSVKVGVHGAWRPLSDAEIAAVQDLPFQGRESVSWKHLRTALSMAPHELFRNVEYTPRQPRRKSGASAQTRATTTFRPEDGVAFSAKGYHALRKAYAAAGLQDAWEVDRDDAARLGIIAAASALFKDPEDARAWMLANDIPAEVANATQHLSSRGFGRLSNKALAKIIPQMQAGLRYDQAVAAAGLKPISIQAVETNGKMPRDCADSIINPRVRRAVRQACLVINAIIDRYGPPSGVHIELARDLPRPMEERRAIEKLQKAYHAARQELATDFMARFARPPHGDELERYALFREQAGCCPYCQKPLEEALVVEGGYAEIDHILPVSRSHVPGRRNQVLVHTHENREKGRRTPFEWLGGAVDSPRWVSFAAWVEANAGYANAKSKRDALLRRSLSSVDSNEFLDRHLNDTRYICVEVKGLIEKYLRDPDGRPLRCVAVNGQATARLRQGWGLMKVRAANALHHAMDAAVIAATSRSLVQKLSEASAAAEAGAPSDFRTRTPLPWPWFRKELLARLSDDPSSALASIEGYPAEIAASATPVRVSRPPRRRLAGEAHGATLMSLDGGSQTTAIKRVPLDKVRLETLKNMVGFDDPRNRKLVEAIKARLLSSEDNPAKAFATPLVKPSRDGAAAPIVRSIKVRVPSCNRMSVRRGREATESLSSHGDMLRTDIYTDGKLFFAVPVYVSDAASSPTLAATIGKPIAQWRDMATPPGKYRFLFSLCQDDWVRVGLPNNGGIVEGYYAGLDTSTAVIGIWPHSSARSRTDHPRRKSLMHLASLQKMGVDPLGVLWSTG